MDQDALNMIQIIEDRRRNVGQDMQEEVERRRKQAEDRKKIKNGGSSSIAEEEKLDATKSENPEVQSAITQKSSQK